MPTSIQSILESYDDNIVALALHIALIPPIETILDTEDITTSLDDSKRLIDDGDYLSLTDEEADALWDTHLEEYIDDVILPELPEACHLYFDRALWIRDARINGRGHSLAGYDGEENEQVYNGTTYYIYRNN